MISLTESDKNEVLTKLREGGLENLLLESWLEDFPLDIYAKLYSFGNGRYMLNVPSIATLFSFPDNYTLAKEEKLSIMSNAAPVVMGPLNIVHEIHKLFPDRAVNDTNLMGMTLATSYSQRTEAIRLVNENNFKDLLDLYKSVPEFSSAFEDYSPEGFAEEYLQADKAGDFITTGIYKEGKLVSAATFRSYEIENVCTRPGFENHGYSTSNLEELLSLIPFTKEGKRIILFTDNSIAMHVYEKLGFEMLGRYSKMC